MMRRLAAWLLRRTLGPSRADTVLGDLEEELAREPALPLPSSLRLLWRAATFSAGVRSKERESTWRHRWMYGWIGDLRMVVRGLRRQPTFALTAIATLSLGIGANAAVLTLAWHTSFRPLPYPEPDQLVQIFESNASAGQRLSESSPASLKAWAERSTVFEAIGTFGRSRVIFPLDDDGVAARYQSLSPGVFAALGIRPILGRVVLADDERQPDEVLISYEYWQRRFGGDPGVIDRLHNFADVADEPERIIGVMPPGFMFLDRADIWAVNLSYRRGNIGPSYRSLRQDSVLARIRPGYDVAEATADVSRISADLSAEFPDTHARWTPVVRTLHETVVGEYRLVALFLVATAGAVFLVACTNVAGLLVMRAAAHRREVNLRLALGASWWRVVRLWLLEGLVVAATGLVAGTVAARWLVEVLAAIAPANMPRLDQVAMSWPTMVVGAVAALGFVAVYASAPLGAGVLRANHASLGGGASRTVASGGRGHGMLLAAQAGLATVLLTGAVLLTSSLQRLYDEPLGFNPEGVLSVRLLPYWAGNPRPWALSADFGRSLEQRLARHPGVSHAAVASVVPLDGTSGDQAFRIEDDPSGRLWGAVEESASPGYLRTLGLELKSGRWFTDEDAFTAEQLTTTQSSDHVAVITESMARTLWPGESAVGKRLISASGDSHPKVVVGVVGDLKFDGADQPPVFRLFVSWNQRPLSSMALLVKATGDPRALTADVEAIVRGIRPSTGIHVARTLDELVQASSADTRLAASLVGGFSLLALGLTGLGVFGVVGYAIAEGRREMAVRLALGAGRLRIWSRAAASGFIPVVVGTGLGVATSLGVMRFIRGLLFDVNPLSPAHYLVAATVLLSVAALASFAPLRRLAAIDPVEALRAE